MPRTALILLALAGCPKPAAPADPAPPVSESGPRSVDDRADLAGANGVRATIVGTLERRRPETAEADGTAIVLADGTAIYVTEGAPPDGWDWLLGTRVRVQGTLWERGESGWAVPKLLEPEAPMPADMGMTP